MSFPKFFQILVASLLSFSVALANDHEAPAEEHGGGGGQEEGHGGKEEPKSTLAPWVPIENKIQELHSKIKSKESNISKLIEEKNHMENNSPHLKSTVKEIVKEHKEMERLIDEYQKNVSLLKYRFPERNAKSGRTYERFEVQSIEEMEKAVGIDGKLNRNLKRMRSQYKSEEKSADPRKPASVVAEPTSHQPKADKKEKSIEDAGSIILQK
jgi:hypothetical protein